MALQGRTFEVSLTPSDQQTPSTSSVPGQMRYIRNGQVTQFDERSIRISKRNGFRQYTKNVRDVTTGAAIGTAGFPAPPSLMSSLALEQVIVSDSHPYVLAEDEASWNKFPYVYSPTTVTQRPVYTANTQILNPDGASIGDVFCHTWSEVIANSANFTVKASFEDSDGAPIRSPFAVYVGGQNARAKVVSDGTYFWILYDAFGDIVAQVYDVHGVLLANQVVFTQVNSSLPWDLTYQQGKVLLCHATPTSTEAIGVDVLTFNGIATISHTFYTLSFNAQGNLGCAWAENNVADSRVYLLTAHYDPDGIDPIERAFQLDVTTTPTITHYYGVGNSTSSFIYDSDGYGGNHGVLVEMTGVNTADGFYIQLSFVDSDTSRNFSGNHKLVRMVMLLASAASVPVPVQRVITSIISASRTFTIDNGRNVQLAYYASGIPAVVFSPNDTTNQQRFLPEPTYFLIDISTGQVCGEFDYASAAMEWERTNYPVLVDGQQYGPFNFCVGHIFVDVNGSKYVSCGYQAQAVNKVVPTNDIFGPAVRLTSTVGVQSLKFGGEGQATEYASELLMPGPLATSFTGYAFGENNLTLAPEQPVLTQSTTSGTHLTLLGHYSYIYVFERTLPNGDRVRSGVSVPQTIQLSGSNNQVVHDIFPLYMTSYSDVIVSVYRNIIDSTGSPGTTHYKVTDDLAPIFNDKGVVSIAFTDKMSDNDASVAEILYTDTGFVNRIPCPAFSCGCVFENRIVVYGLDGAIWYSGEKTEGEAIWFSDDPSFRIAMPTNDPVKNLLPVDGRVGILCERSQWAFTGGGFPGPNGLGGNLQTPQALPFNQGSTGFSAVFPLGAVYSSSAGDAWVFTRGLENKHLGEKAVTDFQGRTVTGISIDQKQRIGFLLAATELASASFEVYDQVAQLWTTYLLPTDAHKCWMLRGAMSYADATSVWVQQDGLFIDRALVFDDSFPILSDYQSEFINIGAVKNFNRIWNQIIQGDYKGPHTLTITTVADSNGQNVSSSYVFQPDATQPFSYSIPPVQEEAARVSFRFQDSYGVDVDPGDTFTVELIAFFVAVGNGLTQLAPFRQIQQQLLPVTGTVSGSSDRVTVLRLNGSQDLKVLPGATSFSFPIGIPAGQTYTVSKLSGPGTVLSPSGIAANPQITTPILSLS